MICIFQGVILFCAPNKTHESTMRCVLDLVLTRAHADKGFPTSLGIVFDCARHLCARAACNAVLYI